MKQAALKTSLVAAALAIIVAIPASLWGTPDGRRLVNEVALPYGIFVLLFLGGSALAWKGARWLGVTFAVVLGVVSFLYFFDMPIIVIPCALLAVAAAVRSQEGPSMHPGTGME